METPSKIALFNALAWIESKKNDAGVDTENVEVGLQCLTEAFKLDLQHDDAKNAYAVTGASFSDIVSAGIHALGLSVQGGDASVEQDAVILKNPDLWKKWVAKLDDKGFFKGTEVGTVEYNGRLTKALGKFKEKFADVKPSTPAMTDKEREAKAEAAKGQGNAALSAGKHQEAVDLYAEAIKLSSKGPNSHIYYANHAAALMYLGRYTDVIDDCEHAIELKPSYIKAYSRMGNAQVQLKDYAGAIDSFRRGLEVDSTNAACKEGLAEAERKLRPENSGNSSMATPAAGGGGGMPDLSALAGMFGGGGGGAGGAGGLAGLMSNPAMQQMAASMMQNPAMMQMAQNMMQNPEMLNNMMGGLGGAGAGNPPSGGGGGMPDIAGMANAFRTNPQLMAARSDPDLADFFRDVDTEGPSAALRHMSNPKVAQLIQTAMAGMQ